MLGINRVSVEHKELYYIYQKAFSGLLAFLNKVSLIIYLNMANLFQ